MLIESLLIGAIGGAIGYSLNIISSAKDKEKEIDIDNIIKYEYIPTELNEKESNEDFIKYSFVSFSLQSGLLMSKKRDDSLS